jgi:hypothetical protein
MLHKFWLPILLLASYSVCAQNASQKVVTNVTRVAIVDPGFSYEAALGSKSTLYSEVGLAPYLRLGWATNEAEDPVFRMDPMASFQYRSYYNFKRRTEKKLRTDLNSLNYIAPAFGISYSKNPIKSDGYDEEDRRLVGTVGLYWGMQRNYKSRFSLDLMIGPGYLFGKTTYYDGVGGSYTENDGRFVLNTRLLLGIWLNKKE